MACQNWGLNEILNGRIFDSQLIYIYIFFFFVPLRFFFFTEILSPPGAAVSWSAMW